MYDNEVNKVYESYKEKVTPYNVKVYGIDEACISALTVAAKLIDVTEGE